MPPIAQTQGKTPTTPEAAKRWLWIALLTTSSVLFSLGLACATPFAAMATLAAVNMRRGDALALVLATWLANQAVGYGWLGYPRTPDSFAWGGAIGVAAIVALFAAEAAAKLARSAGPIIMTAVAFAGAFAVFEIALYATSYLLPSEDEAFSWSVIGWIFSINAVALAGLLVVQFLAWTVGLADRRPIGGEGTAAAA